MESTLKQKSSSQNDKIALQIHKFVVFSWVSLKFSDFFCASTGVGGGAECHGTRCFFFKDILQTLKNMTKTLKNTFFNVFVMCFNVCYVFKKKMSSSISIMTPNLKFLI